MEIWHATRDGKNTLCGEASGKRIHEHYVGLSLDDGAWCWECFNEATKHILQTFPSEGNYETHYNSKV